jgi:putative transposase
MGSEGDAYDNAVAESFFASLAKDVLRRRSFRTRQGARTAIFDYIETFTTGSGSTRGSATCRRRSTR